MSELHISLKHTLLRQNRESLLIAFDYSFSTESQILGVFGPSGTGKSTILKALSGQLSGVEGQLTWRQKTTTYNQAWNNPCVYLGSDTVLFEHLDVFANLELVKIHSDCAKNAVLSLQEVVDLCDLQHVLGQKTQHLSSGEKQRVCFARALLSGKSIFLLDEAFSALDWHKRAHMLDIVKHLHARYALAFIVVSHSLKELALSCNQIVYINEGKVVKQGDAGFMQDYLLNAQHAQESYFSTFTALFSHIEQDDHLVVWELPIDQSIQKDSDDTPTNASDTKTRTTSAKKQYIYQKIKDKQAHNWPDEQVFVVDAHVLMLSKVLMDSTSVLNCLEGRVTRINKEEQGVLVCVTVNGQSFAASISYKSFNMMEIKLKQTLFVCFKAL